MVDYPAYHIPPPQPGYIRWGVVSDVDESIRVETTSRPPYPENITSFELGDVVRVREGLEGGRNYGEDNLSFTEGMEELIGEVFVVESFDEGYVHYKSWCWNDAMLELVSDGERGKEKRESVVKFGKEDIRIGDFVRIVDLGRRSDSRVREHYIGKSCKVRRIYGRYPNGWFNASIILGDTLETNQFSKIRLEKPKGIVVRKGETIGDIDKDAK